VFSFDISVYTCSVESTQHTSALVTMFVKLVMFAGLWCGAIIGLLCCPHKWHRPSIPCLWLSWDRKAI